MARAWAAAAAGVTAIAIVTAACSTSTPSGSASASPSISASPSPPLGTARIEIVGPFGTATWTGGTCDHAGTGEWLAINAGDPNGPEYVGILIGRSPFGPGDASPLASGGSFSGSSVLVTWRHLGIANGLPRGTATASVDVTLSSGTFTGRLASGDVVDGTFDCLATASPPPSPSATASAAPSPTVSPRAPGSPKPSSGVKASAKPSAKPSARPSPTPTPRPS